ncbi:hypothetical protein GWO53_05490 [Corynebacterium macginleyi]|uniref:galactan 5-O-arabinofuranosyltransferase n=1 Tax=Corynebacterium macginleyi TaxID=38290 RepID=UPI0019099795|nr:galactan 5-O-arabinofuranosyltransferase [Corynebacterium macginleyi]MBK4139936.1 hypothetical protein [Corynebacterium macginleyi]
MTSPATPSHTAPVSEQKRTTAYHADALSHRSALLGILFAALGGGIITLLGWYAFKAVSLPSFNTSMVTRALSTVGVTITLVLASGFSAWWIYDHYKETFSRPRWRTWVTYAVTYLSPALLTLASIGLPLSASRLWLDGVQVDQAFRTQFLTRSVDQMGYADMNFLDMPTFYPLGWFWLGGRLGSLLGIPGWEVYQPWALISIAVAGCILVPIWQHLTKSLPVGTAIVLTTTAVTLTIAAEEPYSAVIAMGIPAIAVLSARAFQGSHFSTLAVALYLGISATFYTLFTGAAALTVVSLIAVITAFYERTWRPIVRLIIIAVISIAIALIAWAPYLWSVLHSTAPLQTTAQHYLPEEGTQIPVPFLSMSIVGFLCLAGLIFIVTRLRDAEVRALGLSIIGIYLWTVLSMVMTLVGTTLLSFRLEVIVVLLFATAGILALAEVRTAGIHRLYPASFSPAANKRITAVLSIFLALTGVYYAQQIPEANEDAIDHAYSDTDGYGERADRFSSDSAHYYLDIHNFIQDQGYKANETVVLTDEKTFMAYYPYWGFNAFTSHYANPLGEFKHRNDQIEAWADESWDSTPAEFQKSLDSAPWRGPDALIFRGDLDNKEDGFKVHLAEDIYPNQPNIRYRAVFFNPEVFAQGWELEQTGPFVTAVRTK